MQDPTQRNLFARVRERIAAGLRAYGRRYVQRRAIRELEAMPDHVLKDLGISRSEIHQVVRQGRSQGRPQVRPRASGPDPVAPRRTPPSTGPRRRRQRRGRVQRQAA